MAVCMMSVVVIVFFVVSVVGMFDGVHVFMLRYVGSVLLLVLYWLSALV